MKKISGYVFFEQTLKAFTFTHKFLADQQIFQRFNFNYCLRHDFTLPQKSSVRPSDCKMSVCVSLYVTLQQLTAGGRTHDHDDLRQFAQFDTQVTNQLKWQHRLQRGEERFKVTTAAT